MIGEARFSRDLGRCKCVGYDAATQTVTFEWSRRKGECTLSAWRELEAYS